MGWFGGTPALTRAEQDARKQRNRPITAPGPTVAAGPNGPQARARHAGIDVLVTTEQAARAAEAAAAADPIGMPDPPNARREANAAAAAAKGAATKQRRKAASGGLPPPGLASAAPVLRPARLEARRRLGRSA